MKFLITGAYGFVGTNLCKYLVGKGHVCDALDVPQARRADVPYSSVYTWDDLNHELTPINTNCAGQKIRENPCQSVVDFSHYDCVVHLAGKAHDLKKVASEQSYFDINVGLTQKIFESLVVSGQSLETNNQQPTANHCAFIYFSSCKSVEQDTPYAKSKWAAEEWLREKSLVVSGQSLGGGESSSKLTTNNFPLTTIILRPAPIHGPGNKGNLNLLWSVVKHGIPWPLAAFENKRPFTSIGNICAAVEALAKKVVSGQSLETNNQQLTTNNYQPTTNNSGLTTFFICDDDYVSTNRIIELMAEARGKRARLWRLPKGLMRFVARVGDVLHLPLNTERIEKLTEDYRVDNTELKKALGWEKFPVFVEDGMMETFKSFLAE